MGKRLLVAAMNLAAPGSGLALAGEPLGFAIVAVDCACLVLVAGYGALQGPAWATWAVLAAHGLVGLATAGATYFRGSGGR